MKVKYSKAKYNEKWMNEKADEQMKKDSMQILTEKVVKIEGECHQWSTNERQKNRRKNENNFSFILLSIFRNFTLKEEKCI